MQYKVFTLSLSAPEAATEELNRFLRSHRVLQTERHFSPDNGGYWTLLVEYADGQPGSESTPAQRKDRKDVTLDMDDATRRRFEDLRTIRKRIADDNKVAAFVVFSDRELAILARLPRIDDETTHELKGVPPAKLQTYGRHFYSINPYGKESGLPDAPHHDNDQPA